MHYVCIYSQNNKLWILSTPTTDPLTKFKQDGITNGIYFQTDIPISQLLHIIDLTSTLSNITKSLQHNYSINPLLVQDLYIIESMSRHSNIIKSLKFKNNINPQIIN